MIACEYCRTDGNRGARCECVMPLEQENEASSWYCASFLVGVTRGGVINVPDNVLGLAIDRAVRAKKEPTEAGVLFADTYYKIQQRREPRGGYGSPTAYLLAVYEQELKV